MAIVTSANLKGTLLYAGRTGVSFAPKPDFINTKWRHVSIYISGIFFGATVALQVSTDNGQSWTDTGTTYTQQGRYSLVALTTSLYRLKLSSITIGMVQYNIWCRDLANYGDPNTDGWVAKTLATNALQRPYITVNSGSAGTAGAVLAINVPGIIASTYQWRKNSANIAGATTSTYTTLVGDIDAQIDCVVNSTFISHVMVA